MSLAEIESELDKLTQDQLRQLALKSWAAFVKREALVASPQDCSEHDPDLLASLDEAIAQAEAAPAQGCSATEARTRLAGWTSR